MAVGDKKPVVMEADRAVPGGIATLGTDGKLSSEQIPDMEALGAIEYINSLPFTRKNLLDNWYFADPINQRGQTEYVGAGYTIDRWCQAVTRTFSLSDDGLHTVTPSDIWQRLENPSCFLGRTVTISLMVDNIVVCASGTVPTSMPDSTTVVAETNNNTHRCACYIDANNMWFSIFAAQNATIKAAKLELGSTQTLAHRDENGNWVLNDPPPDKATELAKCQRYYEQTAWHCGFGIAVDTNYIDPVSSYFYKVQKRAAPTVVINANNPQKTVVIKVSDGTGVADVEATQQTAWNMYMIAPRIYSPSGAFVKGELYRVIIPDNAYFISSDL